MVNEAKYLAWNCELKARLSDIVLHLRNNYCQILTQQLQKIFLQCHFKACFHTIVTFWGPENKQERFLKVTRRFFLVLNWTTNSWRGDNEKAKKSCEHGPENGKLSSTKQDGEATTEEVPESIDTYTEEEINTFKDEMASDNTKKSTSTSVRWL